LTLPAVAYATAPALTPPHATGRSADGLEARHGNAHAASQRGSANQHPQAPQVGPTPVRRYRTNPYQGLSTRLQRAKQLAVAGLLVFGLVHASILVYTGGVKVVGLLKQQQAVTQLHHQLAQKNLLLRQDITRYSQPQGVEELARNQLSWIADNELLVRLTALVAPRPAH
jgi:cell division protein FtsB